MIFFLENLRNPARPHQSAAMRQFPTAQLNSMHGRMRATRLRSCHVRKYRESSLGQPTIKCRFECIFCRKKQVLISTSCENLPFCLLCAIRSHQLKSNRKQITENLFTRKSTKTPPLSNIYHTTIARNMNIGI